jgi:uncharacterized protein (TIGR02145 family)
MNLAEHAKLLRRLALSLSAMFALACPLDDDYWTHYAPIPVGAVRASVTTTVVVPEGDWKLRIGGADDWKLSVAQTPHSVEDRDVNCATDCVVRDYVLHCPRGKCSFVFEAMASQPRYALRLSAGIYIADEPEGCAADPNFVPAEELSRLFKITFDVRDVVLGPDAGVRDSGVASGFEAGRGLDAGSKLDASLRADGGLDASAPFGPRAILIDSRDGRRYETVTIGSQNWMAQNLDYGVAQPTFEPYVLPRDDSKVEKYCINYDPAQCSTQGALYTWPEALALPAECLERSCANRVAEVHQGICPAGWHIPSRSEWNELSLYVANVRRTQARTEALAWEEAAALLKSKAGWRTAGSDESGFTASPVGYRTSSGNFMFLAEGTLFQSSEEDGATGFSGPWLLETTAFFGHGPKSDAVSVRCLQNR